MNKNDLSISEAVLSVAGENRNKTALTYMGKSISYKEFSSKIQKLSLSLFSLGIKEGECVLVALSNIPQAVYLLYALNRIGAVPAFVSPLCSEKELEKYIKICNCRFVFAFDFLADKLKTKEVRAITCSPFDELFHFLKSKNSYLSLLIKAEKQNIFLTPQKPEDTAVILFSGGTTGEPKAVELSNRNLNALALGTEAVCEGEVSGVKMLGVLPVFHGFGLGICVHTTLFFGGNVLLVPRFDVEKTARLIKHKKPQYIACVPSMLSPFMSSKALKNADLSFLSGVFSGGDYLSFNLEKSFNDFLVSHNSTVKVRQGYGLTECVAAACLMPATQSRPNSMGKPYPDTFCKIVRVNTCLVAKESEVGEICISSDMVMKGYLNNPDETKEALKVHSDGRVWLHTGDLGYKDGDGFLYFKGRLKRIIISNGLNVYPSEIEKPLLTREDVKDCCAVGLRDEKKLSSVGLLIEMNLDSFDENEKKQELLDFLRAYVSKQALPEYIYFANEIPKTPLGKTSYREAQSLLQEKLLQKKTGCLT